MSKRTFGRRQCFGPSEGGLGAERKGRLTTHTRDVENDCVMTTPMPEFTEQTAAGALSKIYARVRKGREMARGHPSLVERFDIVSTLRSTASSQNIEGGHSTPLGVARAVRRAGESLK